MRTAIYNKVMRMTALLLAGGAMTTNASAQEHLHLFYKNGNHEKIEIKEDTRIEFVKQPAMDAYWSTRNDTIHLSASSGRSFHLGYVESNVDWTITTDDEWLLARKGNSVWEMGSGMEQDYFVVYPTANNSDEYREGKVTIKSVKGDLTKEFVVVQHPYMLTLTPDHRSGYYEPAVIALEETIEWKDTAYYAVVYPNHGVKVLSYPNWMELDYQINGDDYCKFEDILKEEYAQSAGMAGDTYVRFRFNRNDAPNSRTGNIIFEGRGQTAVLTVIQQGLNEGTIANEASTLMNKMYESTTSFRHNDFGFPSVMLGMDCRGTDLVSDGDAYDWFSGWMNYSDLNSDYYYTAILWTSMYNQILAANQVINAYGERAGESLFQFYLGQAYTLRAFNYFYLAQLYQQTYVGNEEAPCVPIIWESDMYGIYTDGRPRATVREVYEYILTDLDKALELLQQTAMERPGKQFVNIEAVYGLRARIYMVMNNWEAAVADAQRVIETSGAVPYAMDEVTQPTFNDINHNAWIWGIDADALKSNSLVTFPSHMGSFSYGYAQVGVWRKVSVKLYEDIPSTDVRKGWFLNAKGYSSNLSEMQSNYAAAYGMPAYAQVKFAPEKGVVIGTQSMFGNGADIPLMRIEEMYLILAEAQAMSGNTTEAVKTLNTFVATYRDPDYSCAATTAEEIQNAVWMQRRIELWGEGHSYYDLMRLEKPVDRRGAGFQEGYVFYIPSGDAARIYQIPSTEMNNNPALVQNPEAAQPQPVAE